MPKIAVIAYFFPPLSQVGYKRPLRFAKHLKKSGYQITVYGADPATPELSNYTGFDKGLLKQIDPDFKVVRTPSVHLFKVGLAFRNRLRNGAHVGSPVTAASAQTSASKAVSVPSSKPPSTAREAASGPGLAKRLVDGIMGSFEIPDPFWGWIFTTLPVVLWKSLWNRPDAIYVTGPPWSPLILATLAGKILRIPVHLDYRDPWNTNTYWKAKKVSLLLERWVMGNAASVISNTASMTESFIKAHPGLEGRLFTVYNGYEAANRARMEGLRERYGEKPRDRFTIAHIGMLYPNRMPPFLARLLAEVAAAWKGPRALRIRFVGTVMDRTALVREFEARGIGDVLEFIGEVDTETAQMEEAKADMLMLLQSGTKEQIPAKVFEYVFTGNPILCVADADSETGNLIQKYALGRVFTGKEPPLQVLEFLQESQGRDAGSREVSQDFLKDFDGEVLSEKMRLAVFKA